MGLADLATRSTYNFEPLLDDCIHCIVHLYVKSRPVIRKRINFLTILRLLP